MGSIVAELRAADDIIVDWADRKSISQNVTPSIQLVIAHSNLNHTCDVRVSSVQCNDVQMAEASKIRATRKYRRSKRLYTRTASHRVRHILPLAGDRLIKLYYLGSRTSLIPVSAQDAPIGDRAGQAQPSPSAIYCALVQHFGCPGFYARARDGHMGVEHYFCQFEQMQT